MSKEKAQNMEEQALMDSLESDEWKPVSDVEKNRLTDAFKAAKKEARINIRLSPIDLELVKRRADAAGLPYQTFLASLIHRFVTDQLVDRASADEAVRTALMHMPQPMFFAHAPGAYNITLMNDPGKTSAVTVSKRSHKKRAAQ